MPKRRMRKKRKIALCIAIAIGLILIATALVLLFININNTESAQDTTDQPDEAAATLSVEGDNAQALFNRILEYDFSLGRNNALEKEIKKYYDDIDMDSSSRILILKAKAKYYYGIDKYHTAITTLSELNDYHLEDEDYLFMYELLAKAYEAIGNTEKASSYQTEYDYLKKLMEMPCYKGNEEAATDESSADGSSVDEDE